MNERDKAIVADIQRFRVLSRDLIADLHFQTNKDKVSNANHVLKRLRRDGYIAASTEPRQYLYFPAEGSIKKDSMKIPHFLRIASFYRDLCKIEKPRTFIVEKKYDKGFPEPDVFMIWKSAPWHVEIQNTKYSDRQIKEKLTRYDSFYLSNEWHKEKWQPQGRFVFPYLWITGEVGYNIGMKSYKVYQASVDEIFDMMNKSAKKS